MCLSSSAANICPKSIWLHLHVCHIVFSPDCLLCVCGLCLWVVKRNVTSRQFRLACAMFFWLPFLLPFNIRCTFSLENFLISNFIFWFMQPENAGPSTACRFSFSFKVLYVEGSQYAKGKKTVHQGNRETLVDAYKRVSKEREKKNVMRAF